MSAFGRMSAVAGCALVAAPTVLHACAVCFDAKEANRAAFVATTVFMSLLPLALVAGLVLWLHRRRQALAAAERELSAPSNP